VIQISISDISKNPSIIDKLDDIAQIINKKTKQVKGVFIPTELLDNFQSIFKELEYKKFVQRNKELQNLTNEDDTILDGLNDEY